MISKLTKSNFFKEDLKNAVIQIVFMIILFGIIMGIGLAYNYIVN